VGHDSAVEGAFVGMAGANIGYKRLNQRVAESFKIGARVGSSYSADAFRIEGRIAQAGDVLWVLRSPLYSSEIEKFCSRLEMMSGHPNVVPIVQFGVDVDDVGYALVKSDGLALFNPKKGNRIEAQQRFGQMLVVVESLHARGITCGDISHESFALNKNHEIILFAPLGDPKCKELKRDDRPTQHFRCRVPQQRSGHVDVAADTHALCVVGAELLEEHQAAVVSTDTGKEREGLPKILKELAEARKGGIFSSVESLRGLLTERGIEFSDAAARKSYESPREGGREHIILKIDRLRDSKDRPESNEAPRTPRAGIRAGRATWKDKHSIVTLMVLNGVALAWLARLSFISTGPSALPGEDLYKQEVAELNRLVMSDDPLVHGKIEKAFKESKEPARRELMLRAILARSRRLGLMRASDVVRVSAYESGVGNSSEVPVEVLIGIRVLDPLQPPQIRRELLSGAYEKAPQFAVNLAASLALDGGDASVFHDVFVRGAEDQVSLDKAAQMSDSALMLLLPDVHDLFSEDIMERADKIPVEDVKVLLSEMAKRERSGIATVAQIARRRGVAEGPGVVFLAELQRSGALEPRVRAALVSGVLGSLSTENVEVFSEWYAPGSARALEAGIVMTQDAQVNDRAFAALRSKPLGDGYVSGVMEFVQATYGEDSERYAPLVAGLALRETLGAAGIKRGLDIVETAPSNRLLAQQILRKAPPDVIYLALPRLRDLLEPTDLTDLLLHPDKAVRLQVIPYLSSVNDILVLKLIQQSFDQEQDADVRKAYENSISVIRERAQGVAHLEG